MKKTALYLRVSTQEQGRSKSIQTQLLKLKEKYPKAIAEYKDIGSGAYIQRDGLDKLRDDAKKGLFNVVAVYSLDRLSRKLGHQIALLEEFEKNNIEVEVLGESYENTPEGMLNRNIRGAFSEYERYKITKRSKDGKHRKAKTDFMGSVPPYGYRIAEKNGKRGLEINEAEAKVVRQAFKIYLEEHALGKTSCRLYDMGFRARTKRKGKHISLSRFMVSHILRSETYIGNSYFGKTYSCEPDNPRKEKRTTKFSSRKYRPKSEWIKLEVPSIIDKHTFERVQEIREEKAKQPLKPTRNYLCQGLIKCAKCGYKYIGKMRSKNKRYKNGCHFYYLCPAKSHLRTPDAKRCPSRTISTSRLDDVVWEYVSSLIRQPVKVKRAVELLRERREGQKGFNQMIYNGLIIQKAEIKKRKSKLLDYFTDGTLLKEDLDEKLGELNSQEKDLKRQVREAERELEKIDKKVNEEKEIEKLCLRYQKNIDSADFDLKRRILKSWVKEITLPDEGGVVIKVRLPQPEEPIRVVSQRELVGAEAVGDL